jgi:hypothetical protein
MKLKIVYLDNGSTYLSTDLKIFGTQFSTKGFSTDNELGAKNTIKECLNKLAQ